jgi:hypothetical protein
MKVGRVAHLYYYLDEFTFRFNRGLSHARSRHCDSHAAVTSSSRASGSPRSRCANCRSGSSTTTPFTHTGRSAIVPRVSP